MTEKSELENVKANVRSLIQSQTSSVYTMLDLQKDYKMMIGHSIPLLGHQSLEHFLRSIPDVVKIDGYGTQALLSYVPSSKSKHIGELVKQQAQGTNKKRHRTRARNPLSTDRAVPFPQFNDSESDWDLGIEKPKEEETTLKKRAEFLKKINKQHENAATTSTENLASTASNVKVSVPNKQSSYLTIRRWLEEINKQQAAEEFSAAPTKGKVENAADQQKQSNGNDDSDEAIPAAAVTHIIQQIDVTHLSKAATFGVSKKEISIQQRDLSEQLQIGGIHSLVIAAVETPWQFYFQFTEETDKFYELHHEMQDVYNSLVRGEDCLTLPDLYAGKTCAAYIDESWQRAIIETMPKYSNDFSTIKLFLLDKGIYCDSTIRRLKYLHAQFANIPPQALCGKLFGIKPRPQLPETSASQTFHEMVNNKQLHGCVTFVDLKNQQVELILLDVSSMPKRRIHEELIKGGKVTEA